MPERGGVIVTLQIMQGYGKVVGKGMTWAAMRFSKVSPCTAWGIAWKAGSRL